MEAMTSPSLNEPRLDQVQSDPSLLRLCSASQLAWLTHEAESFKPDIDDLTIFEIDLVVANRGPNERCHFRTEYLRLWPIHAKARGYHHEP